MTNRALRQALLQDRSRQALLLQAGKGSATLSMAYAAAKFGESCLAALAGRTSLVECAYVESHLTPLPFFASRVMLGPHGVQVCIHQAAPSQP